MTMSIRYFIQTQAPAGNWTDYMGYACRCNADAIEQYEKTAEFLISRDPSTKVRLILREDSVIAASRAAD